MAVSTPFASDIPRLPATKQPSTPDLRSPNPWGVAEDLPGSGCDIEKFVTNRESMSMVAATR